MSSNQSQKKDSFTMSCPNVDEEMAWSSVYEEEKSSSKAGATGSKTFSAVDITVGISEKKTKLGNAEIGPNNEDGGNGNVGMIGPIAISQGERGVGNVKNIDAAETTVLDSYNKDINGGDNDANGSNRKSSKRFTPTSNRFEELSDDDSEEGLPNPQAILQDPRAPVETIEFHFSTTTDTDSNTGPKGKVEGSKGTAKDMANILDEIKKLRERLEKAEKSEKGVDENTRYPQDCYSLIILNGPTGNKWPKKKMAFFGLSMLVVALQFSFLFLTILSRVDKRFADIGTDNPGTDKDTLISSAAVFLFSGYVPANTEYIVSISQFLSLLVYVLFPESSLEDVVCSLQLFPTLADASDGDPVLCAMISSILRGFQGILASFTVLIVVVTSDTVLDIFLNFAALNFISSLDESFIALAKSGVFGPCFQEETRRIEETKLPVCMQKRSHHFCCRITMCSMAALLFSLMIFIASCQSSLDMWLTQELRAEFTQEEFRGYSGCFELNKDLAFARRYTYNSVSGGTNTSFGYCLADRRWIVFDGDSSMDPCLAKEKEVEIARSAETNTFDISAAFELTWSASGAPVDVFFESDKDNLNCNLRIGDGICNEEFNKPVYAYDGGDCCASTCVGTNCGKGNLQSVFGNPNASGDGFPNCKNPDMVSVIIRLDDITSSRNFVDTTSWWFFLQSETDWRNEAPSAPTYLAISCNDKPVMTVYVEASMVNQSEVIHVEDGSKCEVLVKNNTGDPDLSKVPFFQNFPEVEGVDLLSSDAIWYINYTLFHQPDITMENGAIEILNEQSSRKGTVNLTLIPTCFVEELRYETNASTFYEEKAIEWLTNDEPRVSQCGQDAFLERYALIQLFLSFAETLQLENRNEQCNWPSVRCDEEGRISTIELKGAGLEGSIGSEVGMLTKLKSLEIGHNSISSISTEIGLLHSTLAELSLGYNQLSEIPSEIGLLTELTFLSLVGNQLSEIPSEIGLSTELTRLDFYQNPLSEIPSEIGLLTELTMFNLDDNQLSEIPPEIGLLTELATLSLGTNQLSEIPSEIGLLTELTRLELGANQLSEIPSEIGLLTELARLGLVDNQLSELPSEIGLLTELTFLGLAANRQLSEIPSEIGLLTDLTWLTLDHIPLSEIPSEIGLLTELATLGLDNIQLSEIPSEIGLLTELTRLDFYQNQISEIPSMIGLLTHLTHFEISYNQLSEIPTEIGLLTDLTALNLNYNQLSEIPSEIGLLTSLVKLNLTFNELSELPPEIGLLTSLERVGLSAGNNITCADVILPDEVECF